VKTVLILSSIRCEEGLSHKLNAAVARANARDGRQASAMSLPEQRPRTDADETNSRCLLSCVLLNGVANDLLAGMRSAGQGA